MILEFLQTLSEMQIVGELTVLSLLIGGVIMAGGVIIAKIAKLLFHKYYLLDFNGAFYGHMDHIHTTGEIVCIPNEVVIA